MTPPLTPADIAHSWLQLNPLFLDTETTGIGDDDEIVEIAVLDADGHALINTVVKPTILIPPVVTKLHGIDDTRVANAPTIADLWPLIKSTLHTRTIIIFNADFDMRLLVQSAAANRIDPRDLAYRYLCAMKLYADFRGARRWLSLAQAKFACNVKLPDDMMPHRARADAEATRQVVHYMAQQHIEREPNLKEQS